MDTEQIIKDIIEHYNNGGKIDLILLNKVNKFQFSTQVVNYIFMQGNSGIFNFGYISFESRPHKQITHNIVSVVDILEVHVNELTNELKITAVM